VTERTSEVSVVVATRNRAELLPENVEAVLAQQHQGFEAIYVDDDSTDDTPAILEQYATRNPDRMRHVHVECGAPGPARNAGARLARGKFLLFTDDDVLVPAGWIAGMLERHQACGCDALCGGVAPRSLEAPIERYLHCRMQARLGTKPRQIPAAPMMNFLIARDLFWETGGFLEEPIEAGEDWEFCARLRARGGSLFYDPAIQVIHRYQHDHAAALRRIRAAGTLGIYIRAKHHSALWPYTAYSVLRTLTCPFWLPRRYPLDLYGLAMRMEVQFCLSRLRAYGRHVLRGK